LRLFCELVDGECSRIRHCLRAGNV
jgi:hypothetical protein